MNSGLPGPAATDTCQILSLDGGGAKGFYTLAARGKSGSISMVSTTRTDKRWLSKCNTGIGSERQWAANE